MAQYINYNGRMYRYNEKEGLLEWVSNIDFVWNEELQDFEKKTLASPKVVDSIGLNREDAEEGLMAHVANWHDDIQAELMSELRNI